MTVGGDCTYRSPHNRSIVITLHIDGYPGFYAQEKSAAGAAVPVPGVGQDAYAVVAKNTITLKALTAGRIMMLTLALAPGVVTEDLPGLVELARLANGRLR